MNHPQWRMFRLAREFAAINAFISGQSGLKDDKSYGHKINGNFRILKWRYCTI
jgi:hypothetical protein